MWQATDFARALEAYDAFSASTTSRVATSLAALVRTLQIFGPKYTTVSYNGGKDAVAVFHLHRAALAQYYRANPEITPQRPVLSFFQSPDEFPEVNAFIASTQNTYDIELKIYKGPYQVNLRQCIQELQGPPSSTREDTGRPIAFLLGIRQGDPQAHTRSLFEPSSDWLEGVYFVRVHPILDWSYGDVWEFLRTFKLPYCSMYDQGYTSLGTQDDTRPNPMLKNGDGSYRPAYQLQCWEGERFGRLHRRNPTTSPPPLSDAGTDIFTCDLTECQTVGVLMIGNEILKGEVADVNSHVACRYLRQKGLTVHRVAVVGDHEEDIIQEVKLQARLCDVVITSGGLGPTHDDITISAVAKAFGQDLVCHEAMVQILKGVFNTEDLTEHQCRMCLLPRYVELHRWASEKWPIVQCGKVFILPGVPEFFKRKMELICRHLLPDRVVFQNETVLEREELTVAPLLRDVTTRYPDVSIGSYPKYLDGVCVSTTLTIEGHDKHAVDTATAELSCPSNAAQRHPCP